MTLREEFAYICHFRILRDEAETAEVAVDRLISKEEAALKAFRRLRELTRLRKQFECPESDPPGHRIKLGSMIAETKRDLARLKELKSLGVATNWGKNPDAIT